MDLSLKDSGEYLLLTEDGSFETTDEKGLIHITERNGEHHAHVAKVGRRSIPAFRKVFNILKNGYGDHISYKKIDPSEIYENTVLLAEHGHTITFEPSTAKGIQGFYDNHTFPA